MKILKQFASVRFCILAAFVLVLLTMCFTPKRASKELYFRPIWSSSKLTSNRSYIQAQERAIKRAYPELRRMQESLPEGSPYRDVSPDTFASTLSVFDPFTYQEVTGRADYRRHEKVKPKVDIGLLVFIIVLFFGAIFGANYAAVTLRNSEQNKQE